LTFSTPDPTDTRRRVLGLIAQGVGVTCAWDYHLAVDLGYDPALVADLRGVTAGAVRGNISKVQAHLGIEDGMFSQEE
jgi:hypothetical protein